MENICSKDPHGHEVCSTGGHEGSVCASKSESCCCPIQKATEMWTCAFFEAKKQVCVEILKGKILKSCGPKLNKAADAVLGAMEAEWKAMLAKGKAKMDLKAQMTKMIMECEK